MAPWAYQVAAMKKHYDSLIVNAHGAEVLIVFRTAVLGVHIVCASCNLQQHVASYLHDLESDLKVYPLEGDQLAVSCQIALGSLQRSSRTHLPECCIETLLGDLKKCVPSAAQWSCCLLGAAAGDL